MATVWRASPSTPSTVVVAGPQSTLDLLEDLSISDPVDITGRTETFSVEVEPQWPADSVYLSADTVTLTVEIEPVMVSRTFESVKLFSRGATGDVSVSLSLKTLGIVLRGPAAHHGRPARCQRGGLCGRIGSGARLL